MRHFLPHVSLDVEDLRNAATGLGLRQSSSSPGLPSVPETLLDPIDNPVELTDAPPSLALLGNTTAPLEASPSMDNSGLQMANITNATPNHMDELAPASNSEDNLIFDATTAEANKPKRGLENRSGWVSFYQQIHDKFWSSGNGNNAPYSSPALYAGGETTKTVLPTDLPPRDLVERALIAFFSEVNNVVFVLDFEEFEETIAHLYDSKLPSSAAGVMGLLAMVALMERSESSFDAAYRYFDQTLVERSLESVQAIMLLVSELFRISGHI